MPEKRPPPKIDHVADLPVAFSVVLGERAFALEKILELRPGAVLDLSRRHDGPLDAFVSGSRLGQGRAVDIGERLGFRLDEVNGPEAGAPRAGEE